MIPKSNGRGHSFAGVTNYLMHDKRAKTNKRVAWHETGNMITQDPFKAAKVMAWTDKDSDQLKMLAGISNAGCKSTAGAVYHYSLGWARGEEPEREHMREQVINTLKHLGLESHEFYMVAHNDTKNMHVHVVANLTHPMTGKRHELGMDKRELQKWALGYEREHGLHCHVREENAARRARGEHTKYRDEKQAYATKLTRAYYAADNGKSFVRALKAEGLTLALGDKRKYVVVDKNGKIDSLTRQLDIKVEGGKTKAIDKLLAGLDASKFRDANEVAAEFKQSRAQAATITGPKKGAGDRSKKFADAKPKAEKQTEIEKVFHASKNGAAFKRGLKEYGFRLCRGNHGMVAIDKRGKLHSLTKSIDGQTQKKIEQKFADVDHAKLRDFKTVQADIQKERYGRLEKLQRARVEQRRHERHIPKLEKEHRAAQNALDKQSWFNKLVLRSRYRAAQDKLKATQKNLDHARGLWIQDVQNIYERAPDFVKERELSRLRNTGVLATDNKAQSLQKQRIREGVLHERSQIKMTPEMSLQLQNATLQVAKEEKALMVRTRHVAREGSK